MQNLQALHAVASDGVQATGAAAIQAHWKVSSHGGKRRTLTVSVIERGTSQRRRCWYHAAEHGSKSCPSSFVLAEKVLRLWIQNRARPGKASWVRRASVTAEEKGENLIEEPVASTDDGHTSTFNWQQNWYPVIGEQDLDKSVPYPFYILGRKVVFWHDKERWNCVLDVCPHRMAPLSEGRVDEQGCIQCSYHGWSFRGDGSCNRIPQARTEGSESKACDQSKSRAVALPVMVKGRMLFVWPDEYSQELASQTVPPIAPGTDGEGWVAVETFRDLPYGYDTGMENLSDPSHIPVAHHNVNGGIMGKRDQATHLDLEVKTSGSTGFVAEMKKPVGPPSIHTFHAPARFSYEFELKNIKGARAATTTYCTPTTPGNCRIVVVNARNFMTGLSSGPKWYHFFPRWLDHQMMLNLLDGDASLLHEQERYLRLKTDGKVENWKNVYFMPTTADRYVGAFRQWLNRYGGKGVQWAEGVDPSLPPLITKKEDLLDRYNSHTKHCRVCRKASENFVLARKVLFVLAAVSLGSGAILSNVTHRLQAISFAAICGLLGWWLCGWIQMFYYKGYDHARNP